MTVEVETRTHVLEQIIELHRIGNRAVRRAQRENRSHGIPNSYSRDGKLYFELPDGTLTQVSPFKK